MIHTIFAEQNNMNMKKIIIALVVFTAIFAQSATFASNDKTNTPDAPATAVSISGKVLDAITGEALVGAVVEVEGVDVSVFTDLEGQFSINNVQSGTYVLKVKYISYEDKKVESVKVDSRNNNVDITLQSK